MDDESRVNRFVTAFAGAQYHLDCAKNVEWMRSFGIDQARQELQDAFDLLPEHVRLQIMQLRDTLKIDQPAPEVRKVTAMIDFGPQPIGKLGKLARCSGNGLTCLEFCQCDNWKLDAATSQVDRGASHRGGRLCRIDV